MADDLALWIQSHFRLELYVSTREVIASSPTRRVMYFILYIFTMYYMSVSTSEVNEI